MGKIDVLHAKAMPSCSDGGKVSCTPKCKATVDSALATFDGSCCANDNDKEQCKVQVATYIVPMQRCKMAHACPNLGFECDEFAEQDELAEQGTETGVGMLGMMAMALVSAIIGAAVAVTFTQRRSIVSPELL